MVTLSYFRHKEETLHKQKQANKKPSDRNKNKLENPKRARNQPSFQLLHRVKIQKAAEWCP